MEPAKIDWENINSIFVLDDVFEHINAPQWVDFSAPDQSVGDEAWFCRPECNHPKTVEDFLKGTPPSASKLQRTRSVSEILPLGDRNRRDGNLKRRGVAQPPLPFLEDGENQNPNFSTTTSHQYNTMKAVIKSTTEKKQIDSSSQKEERPQLRSTLSARNLFGGRDILNQVAEFCNELKRLATRPKERENVEGENRKKIPVVVNKREEKECEVEKLGGWEEREKERKPLLDVSKEKCEAMEKSNVKEKLRRKQGAEETENIPICLDFQNVKRKECDRLLEIRTCPPSPQCFSAGRDPSKAATPLKASRSRPPERGILQELDRSNTETRKKEHSENNNRGRTASVVAEREARTLDVFWFLKPCTLSS